MRRGLVAVGLLAVLLLVALPAKAASITFESQNVKIGDTFDVNLVVTGLEESVFGFQVNFTFDSSVLSLQSISEGRFLSDSDTGNFNTEPVPSAPPGVRTITNFLSVGVAQPGPASLATLRFVASAAGNAFLTVIPVIAGEFFSLETGFFTTGDTGFERVVPPGTAPFINVVSSTPVPEPSTLGLMGIGLAALARQLRRKRAAKTS